MIWLFLIYFLPFILVVLGQSFHDWKLYGKFDISTGLLGGYIPFLNWLVLYEVYIDLMYLYEDES